MGKIKFEHDPPNALPMVHGVTARAEGAVIEVIPDVSRPAKSHRIVPIKVQMAVDFSRSLHAQLQPAITTSSPLSFAQNCGRHDGVAAERLPKAGLYRCSVSCVLSAGADRLRGLQN